MMTNSNVKNADNIKKLIISGIGLILVILMTAIGSDFQLQQWAQWLVFCILAVSLVWIWGHAGVFSFAQVAFFGIGAYVYGVVGINLSFVSNETISAVVAAVIVSTLFAALLGYFLFYGQISDVFVAISTLAVSLVLNTLMKGTADPWFTIGSAHLGGFNGMGGLPPLMFSLPWGSESIVLYGRSYFAVLGVLAIIIAYAVSKLRSSSFGRIIGAIRENEKRAGLLGINVPKYKVIAFTISASIASLAGAFYAAWGNFIDPTVFGLQMATLLMVWVFTGGQTSLVGAFVGVFVIQKLADEIVSTGTTITPLVLGLILIAVVILLPKGIVPTIQTWWINKSSKSNPSSESKNTVTSKSVDIPLSIYPEKSAVLEAQNVKKLFGGVAAVKQASWRFDHKGVFCLIGSNGAGKSTFFNLLVGLLPVTEGKILLNEQDVTNKTAVWRTQNGMSIKPQVLSLFPKLTIRENLWVAAYAKSKNNQEANQITNDLLLWLGYQGDRADIPVDTIAHGNQQWIDIAMALSQRPSILLLDEPVAGMGKEETSKVAQLAKTLGEHIPVLIVEHDMKFVHETGANQVVVFHQGEVLTAGTLDEVQNDDRVLQVYLGRA